MKAYRVLSYSMLPLINKGDIVFCNQKKEYKPKVGDIVCFKVKGQNTVHRVIEVGSNYIVQTGDQNITSSRVETSCLLGKVELVFKPGNNFLKTNHLIFVSVGWLLLVLRKINPYLSRFVANSLSSLLPFFLKLNYFYSRFLRKIKKVIEP